MPFTTREFPPDRPVSVRETAYRLAILPIVIDEHTSGFVALSATNLEPCAAIVHNLASALRTSQLFHDALEGRKQAEEANRLKSRFLSMVSHELRTPLSLIVGLSEMVLREQSEQPGLSNTALRDLTQVNTSAQHLARLIGDVLDLASSEAGQLRILHEPIDLAEVAAHGGPHWRAVGARERFGLVGRYSPGGSLGAGRSHPPGTGDHQSDQQCRQIHAGRQRKT